MSNQENLIGKSLFPFMGGKLAMADVLRESIKSKLQNLRKSTVARDFLKALKEDNKEKIDSYMQEEAIMNKDSNLKVSGEPIRNVLENNNHQLALILKEAGFTVPPILLLEAISEKKENLIRGLVKFSFFDENSFEVYFWYLLHEKFDEIAEDLLSLSDSLLEYRNLAPGNVKKLVFNMVLAKNALEQAILMKSDIVAESIVISNPQIINKRIIDLGFEHECLGLLKIVATGSPFKAKISVPSNFQSTLFNHLDPQETEYIKEKTNLSKILSHFISESRFSKVRQILTWPEIKKVPNLIQLLIELEIEDATIAFLTLSRKESTPKEFYYAFDTNQLNLCVKMLEIGVKMLSFNHLEFQKKLVTLAKVPETCLQAMEILSRIPTKQWRSSLTRTLCAELIEFVKTTEEILFCPKPILYCVLSAEFFLRLSNQSYVHKAKCLKAMDLFLNLANNIQLKIKGEPDLRFHFLQKDTRRRTALSIVASNNFLTILENEDLGGIIENLWDGSLLSSDYLEASTVASSFYRFYSNPKALQFTDKMNFEKNYIFQYDQWLLSGKNRFFIGEGISVFLLLFIHILLIHRALRFNAFWHLTSNEETKNEFRLLQAWILGIAAEQVLDALFAWKTKRYNLINSWKFLDLCIVIMILLISFQESQGFGATYSYITGPYQNYSVYVLHSILNLLIWLKVFSVLLVTWSLGPFIRMIYFMILRTVNFLIILVAMFFIGAGTFTAVFNKADTTDFPSYDISLRTVVSAASGNFSLNQFTEYMAVGNIAYGIYILIVLIMLINLLIAIITNVYDTLSLKVQSEHRAIIISYSEKYEWDSKYGIFIFLPSPLSSAVLFLSPVILLVKNVEKINDIFCKILFIGYCIPQFLFFAAISFLYILPLYLKGFLIYTASRVSVSDSSEVLETINIQHQRIKKSNKTKKTGKGFLWAIIGLPLIFWAYFRDLFHFWKLAYQKSYHENKIEEISEFCKFEYILTSEFMETLQKALKSIKLNTISIEDLYQTWKMFDSVVNIESKEERDSEAHDFFKQFAFSSKKKTVNVGSMKRLLPKNKGGTYDKEYLGRVKFLNVSAMLNALKKFHANIGSINIAGVNIPKPEARGEFDMTKVNAVNGIIKEIEAYFVKIVKLTSEISMKLKKQEPQ